MHHETSSIESMVPDEERRSIRISSGLRPLSLPALGLSLAGIAIGAILFCCLMGVVALLVLYARVGADGVTDFYQDLKFDLPLKAEVGALGVSALYLGVAITTLSVAAARGGRLWPALVALEPVRGKRRIIAGICLVTLSYAALATLAMTLSQTNRMAVSGPTDYVLLATFSANLVVLAPCAEEFVFRGWLYTGLRHRLAFWPSFLVTASLFAAIHWDANHRRVFLVLPLAVALGVLREATGSIKPTIALHAVYNLVIVAITLLET